MTESMALVQQAAAPVRARAARRRSRQRHGHLERSARPAVVLTSDMAAVERRSKATTAGGPHAALCLDLHRAERAGEGSPRGDRAAPSGDGGAVGRSGHRERVSASRNCSRSVRRTRCRFTRSRRARRKTDRRCASRSTARSTALADFELRTLATETGAPSFFPVDAARADRRLRRRSRPSSRISTRSAISRRIGARRRVPPHRPQDLDARAEVADPRRLPRRAR